MFNNKSKIPLFLASSSPRRAELLKENNIPFTVVKSSFIETGLNSPFTFEAHHKLTESKALGAVVVSSIGIVIASDTVGVADNRILEKPLDENDAFNMLSFLSGRHHDVITSVTLLNLETRELITEHEITTVYFKNVSEKWIKDYIATGEPMDKAAAYAIQGKGKELVDHIEGDYSNVVGLPIALLKRMLNPYFKLIRDFSD